MSRANGLLLTPDHVRTLEGELSDEQADLPLEARLHVYLKYLPDLDTDAHLPDLDTDTHASGVERCGNSRYHGASGSGITKW